MAALTLEKYFHIYGDNYLKLNNIWWQVHRHHVGNKHDTVHLTLHTLV